MPAISNISIEDLKRAVTVIRSGSGKGAAAKHQLTSGAITTATKAAQALTEQKLFHDTKPKTPTSKGLAFADAAEQVLRVYHEMLAKIRAGDNPNEGTVTLHISELLMATVAIPALVELRSAPDYRVKINICIGPAVDAIRALHNDETQLVMTLSEHPRGGKPSRKLDTLAEIESPLVVVAAKDFLLPGTDRALCSLDGISLDELEAWKVPLALPPDTFALRRIVDRMTEDGRATPVLSINSISHLRHCARVKLAATILPEISAATELTDGQLASVPLKTSPPIQTWFGLYQSAGEVLTPTVKRIAEVLTAHLEKFDKERNPRRQPAKAR